MMDHEVRHAEDGAIAALAQRMDSVTEGLTEMRGDMRVLTSAIAKLAVIDERQVQASLSLERSFAMLSKIDTRLDTTADRVAVLERAAPLTQQIQGWILAAVWASVGLVVMFIVKKAGLL
jgi:hypothetical protein